MLGYLGSKEPLWICNYFPETPVQVQIPHSLRQKSGDYQNLLKSVKHEHYPLGKGNQSLSRVEGEVGVGREILRSKKGSFKGPKHTQANKNQTHNQKTKTNKTRFTPVPHPPTKDKATVRKEV